MLPDKAVAIGRKRREGRGRNGVVDAEIERERGDIVLALTS